MTFFDSKHPFGVPKQKLMIDVGKKLVTGKLKNLLQEKSWGLFQPLIVVYMRI